MHNYSKVKPNLIFFILGPLILIIGVVFMITSFSGDKPLLFPYFESTQINAEDVYDFGNVVVIGEYAYGYYEEEGAETTDISDEDVFCNYYLIAIGDDLNGYNQLASLTVSANDSVYDRLDLLVSDSYYTSDDIVYVDLCATASQLPSDVFSFYQEAVHLAQSYVPDLEYSGLTLNFFCEGDAQFDKTVQSSDTTMLIMGILMLVFGPAVIVLGMVDWNRRKKAVASMQNFSAPYPPNYKMNHDYMGNGKPVNSFNGYAQQHSPYQGNYHIPPQGNYYAPPHDEDTQILNNQPAQGGANHSQQNVPPQYRHQNIPPQNMPPKK